MEVLELGIVPYREAWALQERLHAEVVAGGEEKLLLLEHPPVITFGRRGPTPHLLASEAELAQRGIELVHSDRGGDVTFHGPGQLIAYPIIRLADHGLSVGGYVHALEDAVIATLAAFGTEAVKDPAAVGVWVAGAKIAAIGVRIRRGVSMHGVALNVTTDLDGFRLIVPCGLPSAVTSLQRLKPGTPQEMPKVKSRLAEKLRAALPDGAACVVK
jgi:lipoyl(octanoyl) transferase